MDTPVVSDSSSSAPLPRKGLPFFLLWVAISCVYVAFTALMFRPRALGSLAALEELILWHHALTCVISGCLGWLLFGRSWRTVLWALLAPVAPGGVDDLYYLIKSGVQVSLLLGVRQRPWLWIVASLLAGVLYSVPIMLPVSQMLSSTSASFGVPFPLIALSWIERGGQQIGVVLGGAVLAWFMPPIGLRRASGKDREPAPNEA